MNDIKKLKADAVFTGMEQCTTATGIDIDIIKRAKVHPDGSDGVNGFHQSGRIYWAKLKPWLDEHIEELTTGNADDYFKWRAIRMESQAKLSQIELDLKKEKLIEKDNIHNLLRRIAHAQSSLMNSKFRQELIPKMEGRTEPERQLLMDAAITEFMNLLQREIKEWEKK